MLTTGLKAWVIQRITAIYLAIFTLWIVIHFLFDSPQHYQDWVQWLAKPYVTVAIGLFFLSLIFHSWVGLRDVIMDYIGSVALRSVLLVALLFFLIAMLFWSLIILFGIEH